MKGFVEKNEITEKDFEKIFGMIDPILKFHQNLFERLEELKDNPRKIILLSKLFVELIEKSQFRSLYLKFIVGKQKASDHFEKIIKSNQNVKEWFDKSSLELDLDNIWISKKKKNV